MLELGINPHHPDAAFLEENGGSELLLHLRAGASRGRYRAAAIQRALRRFEAAVAEGLPEDEIGGLGLIVLQRSVLPLEDIGGLIHAVLGSCTDQFGALCGTTVLDLDEAMRVAVEDPVRVMREVMRLADEKELRALAKDKDEPATPEQVDALLSLRGLQVQRWTAMLERAGAMWLQLRDPAKATMHGFSFVAGPLARDEPCGSITEDLPAPSDRFALGLLGLHHFKARHIETRRVIVDLDDATVRAYARTGGSSAKLYGEASRSRASAIDQCARGVLDPGLVHRLPRTDQDHLKPLGMPTRGEC